MNIQGFNGFTLLHFYRGYNFYHQFENLLENLTFETIWEEN